MAEKMPNYNSYVYVANNPIMFVDSDGRKIVPSATFSKKAFGRIHNSLMKNNSTYNSLLGKYKKSNGFNLYLYLNENRVSSGGRASTEIRDGYIDWD